MADSEKREIPAGFCVTSYWTRAELTVKRNTFEHAFEKRMDYIRDELRAEIEKARAAALAEQNNG